MASKMTSWYKAPRGEAFSAVHSTAKYIRNQQSLQRLDVAHFEALYLQNVSGLGRSLGDLSGYYHGQGPTGMRGGRFNMCAAVVDTAHSLIAASPPVPIYITNGTNLSIVRKAERRSKVLQSQINELGGDVIPAAFLNACKTGTGIVYGYLDDDGLPKLELVHQLELLVEHSDGFYGSPKSIHRQKYVHREHLASLYPSKRQAILKATSDVGDDFVGRFFVAGITDRSEMVSVVESWYLGVRGKPGRHTITCSTCDLLDEDWTARDFPFAVVRYRNRAFGYYGSGLIESCRENQNRVNKLIQRVAKAQDLASTLMIFNPTGENMLDPQHITNEVGLVFNFDGGLGTPTLAKWDGTLVDLQQQIDLEFERVLRTEGIGESQAYGDGAGKGLSSAVAHRAKDDISSRRLINPVKLFSTFCIDVARLVERLNDEAADRDEGYSARGYLEGAGRNFLKSSRWKDLDIPEGEAVLNLMPMSSLPTTAAGKFSAVSEMVSAGYLGKPAAMKLLQMPAIDEMAALETSQLDLCLWQMEALMDADLPDAPLTLPMERQDLAMCMDVATKVWAQIIPMAPTDAVLDAFDQYLDYAKSLLESAQPPAPPPMDPSMAPPGGAAMPQGGIMPVAMAAPAG
jgi:hypothetical protein